MRRAGINKAFDLWRAGPLAGASFSRLSGPKAHAPLQTLFLMPTRAAWDYIRPDAGRGLQSKSAMGHPDACIAVAPGRAKGWIHG
ncbi:hypothetical protein SAMN05428950_10433 [Sphingomonas sp. OV641]|nr:hypothetical protein SAMN05428950_10433 [Sphingomonas sp. OV641]